MIETKYNVLIGKRVVASNMTLENAVILLKGLFNEYYNDTMLAVTIEVASLKAEEVTLDNLDFLDNEA